MKTKELVEKFLFQKSQESGVESPGSLQPATLMSFIDNECRIIYTMEVSQKNRTQIVQALWTMVESEISKNFAEKKSRNKEKNKPSRFLYFQLSLPVMLEAKQIIFENLEIPDINIETYQISKK